MRQQKIRLPTTRGTRAMDTFELSDEAKEGTQLANGLLWSDPANDDVFDPRPDQRIPKTGAWVMITRQLPAIERGLDKEIRVGRVFWATHDGAADEYGFIPSGMYRLLLQPPSGDVYVLPYEYSVINPDVLIACWTLGELIFHPTKLDDAKFNSHVYYCRSRGIGLEDATVMVLGSITGNIGWFEPRPDLAEEAEAMAARVHGPMRRSRLGVRVEAPANAGED